MKKHPTQVLRYEDALAHRISKPHMKAELDGEEDFG